MNEGLVLLDEHGMVLSMNTAAKQNVTLSIEGEPLTIYGVRRYIYEIIYNLCDNAIRYNVDGGKVKIKIENQNGCAVP